MNPRVREAIASATATLVQAGIDSARTDAELLAAYAAGTERGRLALLDPNTGGFHERFAGAVAARAQRIPLQHITGTAAFGPVQVQVGPFGGDRPAAGGGNGVNKAAALPLE